LRRDADVLGVRAAREIVPPRQEMVDPGGHRVAVAPRFGDRERAAPAVVAQRRHRRLAPLDLVVAAPAQAAGEHVVTVGEAVGLDVDLVADDALDRKASAVDRRRDALDDGAAVAGRGDVRRRRHREFVDRHRLTAA